MNAPLTDDLNATDKTHQSKQPGRVKAFLKNNVTAIVLIVTFLFGLAGATISVIWEMGRYSGELTSNIGNLEGKVSEVKGDIKDVKIELGGLQNKVQTLSNDVSYIKGRLDERGVTKKSTPAKLSDPKNLSMDMK